MGWIKVIVIYSGQKLNIAQWMSTKTSPWAGNKRTKASTENITTPHSILAMYFVVYNYIYQIEIDAVSRCL